MKSNIIAQISALAFNVWRQSIRDRLVYILVGSGILVMFSSIVLGEMAVGARGRVVQNTGFWVLGIWGLIAVLYIGSTIVKQEIQQKTIYLVLSRPMNRTTFLLGKYVGILVTLICIFVMLSLSWLFLLQIHSINITNEHLLALLFILGEWFLIAALSLFFASFTTPLLHNFFIVAITFLGHWTNDLRLFAENVHSIWTKNLLLAFYYVLPNLEALNFRENALYDTGIRIDLVLQAMGVLSLWIFTFLIAAILVFSRRKLV